MTTPTDATPKSDDARPSAQQSQFERRARLAASNGRLGSRGGVVAIAERARKPVNVRLQSNSTASFRPPARLCLADSRSFAKCGGVSVRSVCNEATL